MGRHRQQAAAASSIAEWQQGNASKPKVQAEQSHTQHQQAPLEQPQCSAAGQGQGGEEGPLSVHYWQGIQQLLFNPRALVFFGMVLTMGFGVGNIEGYLFLYLDSLGEDRGDGSTVKSGVPWMRNCREVLESKRAPFWEGPMGRHCPLSQV
jgi:hypothetical protein